MKCPFCNKEESKVVDKRNLNLEIRRRRECLGCKKRYTTYERIGSLNFYVIKKDNRRELFDREKLLRGILKACEKRPIAKEKIDKMVDEIELRLRINKGDVKSRNIGEMVMKKLRKLDSVAYIRFASVYRDFTDAKDFMREVKEIRRG